jgi:outer membrane protein, adhesin transport system
MRPLKKGIVCLAALWLPMGCGSQSLQEAVLMALAHYPSMASSRYQTEAARSDITRAKGAHWPQLSWSGTYNDYRSDGLPNRWIQTPVLSLNLWSGGRIQSDVERSQAQAKASQKQEYINRDDVALITSEAYLQWAHQKRVYQLATENLGAHEKILNDFKIITQVDPGRRIDLNQAQVRFDNAQLSMIRSEIDLRVAAERLARMIMAPAPAEPSGLEFSPAIPYQTLAQAQAELHDQHPVIGRLLAQREAAQASVRYAQAQGLPTVNISHGKSTIPGLVQGQFITQLQLNVPLIDGGTARGAVGVAMANLQSLDADLVEARLTLNEQLASSWASWQLSGQRADMGREQTRTAQSLALGYEQQFRVGRRSLLDLLNIQSDLYTYKSNAANALNESRLSQVRILANLGQLANAYSVAAAAVAPLALPQTLDSHPPSTNTTPVLSVQAMTPAEPESTPLSNLE